MPLLLNRASKFFKIGVSKQALFYRDKIEVATLMDTTLFTQKKRNSRSG